MTIDFEQVAQEDALFPWLASDCMADPCEEDFFDELNEFEGRVSINGKKKRGFTSSVTFNVDGKLCEVAAIHVCGER